LLFLTPATKAATGLPEADEQAGTGDLQTAAAAGVRLGNSLPDSFSIHPGSGGATSVTAVFPDIFEKNSFHTI